MNRREFFAATPICLLALPKNKLPVLEFKDDKLVMTKELLYTLKHNFKALDKKVYGVSKQITVWIKKENALPYFRRDGLYWGEANFYYCPMSGYWCVYPTDNSNVERTTGCGRIESGL